LLSFQARCWTHSASFPTVSRLSSLGVNLNTRLHLVPKSRMCGFMTLFKFHGAVLIKHRDYFYVHFVVDYMCVGYVID
jgi:hypothetical protein